MKLGVFDIRLTIKRKPKKKDTEFGAMLIMNALAEVDNEFPNSHFSFSYDPETGEPYCLVTVEGVKWNDIDARMEKHEAFKQCESLHHFISVTP